MNENEVIQLFKCLADKSRLQILKSLMQQDMYVELLAERLDLTPATISFHLKKLESVGAVTSYREQYYTIYSVCRETFQMNLIDVIGTASAQEKDIAERELTYRKKVLTTFFKYGKLIKIPTQRKKQLICLEEIAKAFEIGKNYEEKEVNEIIKEYFDDYCTIRRNMIAEKILKREGNTYIRISGESDENDKN